MEKNINKVSLIELNCKKGFIYHHQRILQLVFQWGAEEAVVKRTLITTQAQLFERISGYKGLEPPETKQKLFLNAHCLLKFSSPKNVLWRCAFLSAADSENIQTCSIEEEEERVRRRDEQKKTDGMNWTKKVQLSFSQS